MENVENLYKFTVLLASDLGASDDIQKTLLKIVADGVITEEERPELQKVINFLTNLERRASELKIYAEKHLK